LTTQRTLHDGDWFLLRGLSSWVLSQRFHALAFTPHNKLRLTTVNGWLECLQHVSLSVSCFHCDHRLYTRQQQCCCLLSSVTGLPLSCQMPFAPLSFLYVIFSQRLTSFSNSLTTLLNQDTAYTTCTV
jgi:hypothetical protein